MYIHVVLMVCYNAHSHIKDHMIIIAVKISMHAWKFR